MQFGGKEGLERRTYPEAVPKVHVVRILVDQVDSSTADHEEGTVLLSTEEACGIDQRRARVAADKLGDALEQPRGNQVLRGKEAGLDFTACAVRQVCGVALVKSGLN